MAFRRLVLPRMFSPYTTTTPDSFGNSRSWGVAKGPNPSISSLLRRSISPEPLGPGQGLPRWPATLKPHRLGTPLRRRSRLLQKLPGATDTGPLGPTQIGRAHVLTP